MADVVALTNFIDGLPEGDRHKGFFWAANVAVEDGLDRSEQAKIVTAAIAVGLDEAYVHRTMDEVRRAHHVRGLSLAGRSGFVA